MQRILAGAVTLAMLLAGPRPGSAQTGATAALSAIEFDEIDHVYTTDAVPPPGSFQQDAAQAVQAPPATPAPRKKDTVFGALGRASSIAGGASSIVSASGEIGRVLTITETAARLVPLANVMGLAGNRRFDTLLQTYTLPRVSPTGAVMLQGFLAAQSEYKSRFGPPPRDTTQPAPPALAPYAKGALRHYTVASNGWVRIDDPATKSIVIVKPDLGKSYTIDPAARTIRVADYAQAAMAETPSRSTGTASFEDQVEALGQTTIEGVTALGYRTRSTIRIEGGGGTCPDTTVTSTRVEYFASYRNPSDAANATPAQKADGNCEPRASLKHSGPKVPTDQLVLYQANTIEKRTGGATDRYTVVIQRGNFRTQPTADAAAFDLPATFQHVAR